MSELKQRFSVTASGLGSYCGVGFATPHDQLLIDLGEKAPFINDYIQDKFNQGNTMENAILDYFEGVLNTRITERNIVTYDVLEGMLRVKPDGICTYEGARTTIDAKFSSADAPFTEDKGYLLQLHAGMMAQGTEQAIILGFHKGKPIWRLYKKDQNIIELIEAIVPTIFMILNGILDKEMLPTEGFEYFSSTVYDETEEVAFEEQDKSWLESYILVNQQIKELETQKALIAENLKSKYPYTRGEVEGYKITVADQTRKGGLDMDALRMAYPEIDFDQFTKPASVSKVLRVTAPKGGNKCLSLDYSM